LVVLCPFSEPVRVHASRERSLQGVAPYRVVHHLVSIVELAVLAKEEKLAVKDCEEGPAHLQRADFEGLASRSSVMGPSLQATSFSIYYTFQISQYRNIVYLEYTSIPVYHQW